MSVRAASYTMPTAIVDTAPPADPPSTRAAPERLTSHEASVGVLKVIMDNTSMNEQEALSLFIAITNDVSTKRYFDGGSKFMGRMSEIDLKKLTLAAFSENIGLAYPRLAANDVAANVAMCASYFFEYTPSTMADVEEQILASWDEQFLVKVDRLITALGGFAQSSGASDVAEHIRRNATIVNDRSVQGRLAQSIFSADMSGAILESLRRNPALASQIPHGYLDCAVKELTEEQTLAPVAYGHHGSITAINVNVLQKTTAVKKPTQSDLTTIPLIVSPTNRPDDEAISRLDHFGVSSGVIGFTLAGYHVFAKKRLIQRTEGGDQVEDIVSLWCRDSSDPFVHQPYLMAALCNNVHMCLGTSVTKPSFAFRASSSFRGEIQRVMTRHGLIPRDAIQVPVRLRKEKGRKTDPKKKKNSAGSRSSVALTDTTSIASGSWADDTVPATPAAPTDSSDKTFSDKLVKEGVLPGTPLLKQNQPLGMHSAAALRAAMGDYLSYASVAKEVQIFRANTASRSLAYSARCIASFLYNFVSDAVAQRQKGLVHETFNAIYPRVVTNLKGAMESVELIMTKEDRQWKRENVRLVLARIVLAIILQTLEGKAYTLALQGTCVKFTKAHQNQFRSDRSTQRRPQRAPRHRSVSRDRRNGGGGDRGGFQGYNAP